MRVVSVNVGLPREVEWRDSIVSTAIFKEPVEERIPLRRLNLAGDAQADLTVHGGPEKAVYAYASEHYPEWEERLGRTLPRAAFGENLTTEGLLEDRVHIGDEFLVGTARLVVTQMRMPCYKLGIRFDDPGMVKNFLRVGLPGIYFAVVEESEVGPGDAIELVHSDPRGVTVRDMLRLALDRRAAAEELRIRRATSKQRLTMTPRDESRKYGWWWYVLLVWCGVLFVTAFAPLLPVNWWWVRLGDYPRLQLLGAYVVTLAVLAIFYRHAWAKWLAAALVLCCLIQLYWIFPYLPFAPQSVQSARSDDARSRLRIVSINVLQENDNAQAVLEIVRREQPDLLVLCEVNRRWMNDLAKLDEQFSFSKKHPLENRYGIALYSNLEVTACRVRAMVKDEIPSIDATVRLRNGHPVRVFAVHPNPPRPGESTAKRDAELVLVGREVADDESAIVLGDMNDVGWSRTTDLFQEVSGLLDPREGRGFYSTYDATNWLLRYPLDYIFQSDDFRVAEIRILEFIGSDHFPLLIELSYEPAAERAQEAPELDAGDKEDADEAVDAV